MAAADLVRRQGHGSFNSFLTGVDFPLAMDEHWAQVMIGRLGTK